MAFRGLAFDIFGTVVDWRGSLSAEAESLLGPAGHSADWNQLALDWRRRYQPSMDRVRSGAIPWTNLDDLHAASLNEVLDQHGLQAVQPELRAELTRAWHRLRPWPDSRSGLTRLAASYLLVTLSNGNRELLTDLVGSAGLPFHQVLSAEDVRAYKPDPLMYLHAANSMGCAPGETLMVAAHLEDLQAAGRSGLGTAYVSRPFEWLDTPGPADAPKPWLDYYATDLEDLAEQLGC